MSVKIYNPSQVLFLFGLVPIKGFADGTFIAIESPEKFTTKTGADGTTVRAKTNKNVDRVKLTLMYGSDGNDILSAIHTLDVDSPNGAGVSTLAIKDLSGRFLYAAPESWIIKPPNIEFATEPGQREWELDAVDAKRFDGGA